MSVIYYTDKIVIPYIIQTYNIPNYAFRVPYWMIDKNMIMANNGIKNAELLANAIGYDISEFIIPVKKVEEEKHTNIPEAMTTALQVLPMSSRKPAFRKDQTVIDTTGYYKLDNNGNAVIAIYEALSTKQRETYLQAAINIERRSGRSDFGIKPREEVCYTVHGRPYKYSNVAHYTIKFPPHILHLVPEFLKMIQDYLPTGQINPYTELSNAVDIMYSNKFARGGSISAHKDDEDKWGLVIIYSLGQTRWLRVRNDKTHHFTNIKLEDNSIIAMYGSTFQTSYTHQVDKLTANEPVGNRLSLNIRFLANSSNSDQ